MSNYTPTTDFASKDALPSGDPAKIIKGTDFSVEFNNIATAVASKANTDSPTFTGVVTISDLNFVGTLDSGTIDGGTY
jgi:hypothetical protein